jgi:hypothetical protein
MASTLTELRARARSFVPDRDGSFIADGDLDNYINEAYLDLADRLDGIELEFDGTTSGSTITLPPSGGTTIKRVSSLRIDEEDVAFVDDVTFNAYSADVSDPGFTIGRVFASTVELFPDPGSGTDYVLRCVVIPAVLTASDTHQLPVWIERKLVDFAAYRACMKADELYRGREFLSMYLEGLPEPSYGKDRSIPGPLTLVTPAGPFDIDIEAQHI